MKKIFMPAEDSPAYKAVSVCTDILEKNGIGAASCLPMSECRVQKPYLLKFEPGCVVMFTVPYFTGDDEPRNISRYAVSLDYHSFFSELAAQLKAACDSDLPGTAICTYSDHSPIYEAEAASKAGIGCIGENHLLITEGYGSYIFIGEIFLSEPLEPRAEGYPISHCPGCGRCMKACPGKGQTCLSYLTQKKGELTADEEQMIAESGCCWGCDICQEVCPLNRDVKTTEAQFFYERRTPTVTTEMINSMTDEQFAERAYAWRGRKTILRNLEIERRHKTAKPIK